MFDREPSNKIDGPLTARGHTGVDRVPSILLEGRPQATRCPAAPIGRMSFTESATPVRAPARMDG